MLSPSIRDGIKSNQKVTLIAHDSSTVGSWLSLLAVCAPCRAQPGDSRPSAQSVRLSAQSPHEFCTAAPLNLILHMCICAGDRE